LAAIVKKTKERLVLERDLIKEEKVEHKKTEKRSRDESGLVRKNVDNNKSSSNAKKSRQNRKEGGNRTKECDDPQASDTFERGGKKVSMRERKKKQHSHKTKKN